jgi:hypothetical protein
MREHELELPAGNRHNNLPKGQEELKEELLSYIDRKCEALYDSSRTMLKEFQIEIIRQFEIQKVRTT